MKDWMEKNDRCYEASHYWAIACNWNVHGFLVQNLNYTLIKVSVEMLNRSDRQKTSTLNPISD